MTVRASAWLGRESDGEGEWSERERQRDRETERHTERKRIERPRRAKGRLIDRGSRN